MMCHDTDCMDSNRCFICHNDILFWSAVWRRGLLNTKLILTKLLVWSAHQSVIHDQHTGKKFSKSYMLARELGRGAFSVVKLGVNKVLFVCLFVCLFVSHIIIHIQLLACMSMKSFSVVSGLCLPIILFWIISLYSKREIMLR